MPPAPKNPRLAEIDTEALAEAIVKQIVNTIEEQGSLLGYTLTSGQGTFQKSLEKYIRLAKYGEACPYAPLVLETLRLFDSFIQDKTTKDNLELVIRAVRARELLQLNKPIEATQLAALASLAPNHVRSMIRKRNIKATTPVRGRIMIAAKEARRFLA